MKIGFVFTNYNSSKYTKEAIQSISLNNNTSEYYIVVIDNNSNDENLVLLNSIKKEFNNVILLLNKENIGYFRGLNVGIKYLRTNFDNIEYVIIGNNDLIFPKSFFDSIYKNISTIDSYAVISPDVVTDKGLHQNPHVIHKISKLREIIYDLYYTNYLLAYIIKKIAKITNRITDRNDEKHYKIPQTIYQGHGSCYILSPIFFRHFEELWAPTFLMGEEFFLSIQLKSKHLHLYYEPGISVIHQCHSSIDKIPSKKMWKIAQQSHKEYRKYIKIFG